MSRGRGKAQRAILSELERVSNASVTELAAVIYGQRWTWRGMRVRLADYEATRRAMQGLVLRGLVRELPRGSPGADGRTHIKRYALSVGLTEINGRR